VGSSKEVAEGIVEQVDERCCIEIGISHHLTGKQGLPGATAKQASHHPVAHVHVMSHFLDASLDGANVWALIAAAVKMPEDKENSTENLQKRRLPNIGDSRRGRGLLGKTFFFLEDAETYL